jgi:monoterpene epsilon-lactone hydrolase
MNRTLRYAVKGRLDSVKDPERLRLLMEYIDKLVPKPRDVRTEVVDAGGVPSELIRLPRSRDERIILYLHGGGFVTRSPHTHVRLLAQLCRGTGATGFTPDYRLAPEHPFPAAPDDCLTAYRWLLSQGHEAKNIVIAGDSAGGCLTLVTLARIRIGGDPMPGCAVLLSPATDLAKTGPSHTENLQKDPFATPEALDICINAYLDGTLETNPLVSPLYGDFHGFPPLLFQVGSTEMLRDDSVLAAEKAKKAGVDVTCEVWDLMPHVFQAFGILPESQRAIANITKFVLAKMKWDNSQ